MKSLTDAEMGQEKFKRKGEKAKKEGERKTASWHIEYLSNNRFFTDIH